MRILRKAINRSHLCWKYRCNGLRRDLGCFLSVSFQRLAEQFGQLDVPSHLLILRGRIRNHSGSREPALQSGGSVNLVPHCGGVDRGFAVFSNGTSMTAIS